MTTSATLTQLEGLSVDHVDITIYGLSKGCVKCDMTFRRLAGLGFNINKIDVDTATDEEAKSFPKMQGMSAPLVIVSIPEIQKEYHWNDVRMEPLTALKNQTIASDLVEKFDELVLDNKGLRAGAPEF